MGAWDIGKFGWVPDWMVRKEEKEKKKEKEKGEQDDTLQNLRA